MWRGRAVLTRCFGESTSAAYRKYSKVIQENSNYWNMLLPKKAGPELRFFPDESFEKESLDYSLSIIWDLAGRKGKAIRPILITQLGDLLGVDRRLSLPVAYMVETVHNCTLIIDDIEDNSEYRRGDKCVHLKFGVDSSINSGCLGYFLPISNLVNYFKQQPQLLGSDQILGISEIYLEEMKNIHLGLAWDIFWHSKHHKVSTLPTEADYLRMVESKTSVLLRIGFRMISELARSQSAESQRATKLANRIGASFQIKDDLINLTEGDYRGKGSGIGDDITEGKITLMVIEHVRRTGDQKLLDTLALKTKDQQLIKSCIASMVKSGALEYAESQQHSLMSQARDSLRGLVGNSEVKQDMEDVLSDLLARKK